MKIALCLSGQPRFIENHFQVYKQILLDHYDVDVFVHTWWDPNNLSQHSVIPDRSERTYSPHALNAIYQLYQPKKMVHELPKFWTRQYEITEKQLEEGPSWAKNAVGGLDAGKRYLCNMTNSMWYSIMMANLLKEQYSVDNTIEYDMVVRGRFDFVPHVLLDFNQFILKEDDIVCHSTGLPYDMPHDWFAFGPTESMNAYCGIYNHINELVKQSNRLDGWWCNELLIKHHLNNNNITIRHANLSVLQR